MEAYDASSSPWDHLYISSRRTLDRPVFLSASVVPGFQRGSKELGIPTANLSMEELGEERGEGLSTGIYYGLAHLRGSTYRAVVSVGWNPFYKNTKKTIEAHILHTLDDFYSETLSLLLFGYLRDETNFKSVDELISCINNDIKFAAEDLTKYSVEATYSDVATWSV